MDKIIIVIGDNAILNRSFSLIKIGIYKNDDKVRATTRLSSRHVLIFGFIFPLFLQQQLIMSVQLYIYCTSYQSIPSTVQFLFSLICRVHALVY